MDTFAAGNIVTLIVPFVDQNGVEITPTAISRRVLDENEAEIAAAQVVSLPSGGAELEIAVPAQFNTLGAGVNEGLRTVEVTFTTATGTTVVKVDYVLRTATRLVVLENSFQTMGQAKLTATGISKLIGWEGGADFERQTALIEAYLRLTRFGYFVRWPREIDDQRYLDPGIDRRIAPNHWPLMTMEQFLTWYPEEFRAALRRAQVIEANQILGSDDIGERRRAGLMSESIGESSMMFRNGKPLDMPVCSAAMNALAGYIDFRIVLTRS